MTNPGMLAVTIAAAMLWSGMAMAQAPGPMPAWNVKDFGAKGDRQTKDHGAIQQAVDACHEAGGGTVFVPAGDYLVGAIALKSNVTLHLDAGATLWASTEQADYEAVEYKAPIMAQGAEHVAITGRGRVHGQGLSEQRPPFRPTMVYLVDCKDALIEGIRIEYASAWTIHLRRCDTVYIQGVTILNNRLRLNTDGIDPNCSRNVHISDCHIVAGDDCIVLKATEEGICENVTVSNCTLETTCAALKLGTESRGDIRHCTFSNCVIRNTRVGIAFYMKDGARFDNITFSNITMETGDERGRSEWPIVMTLEKRYPDSKVGRIRNVTFSNLLIRSPGRCLLEGLAESPMENVRFEGLTINAPGFGELGRHPRGGRASGETYSPAYDDVPAHLVFAHLRGLTLRDVRINWEPEEAPPAHLAVYADDVEDVLVDGLRSSALATGGDLPLLRLRRCRDVLMRGCRAPEGTGTFLELQGDETKGVALIGNDLRRAKRAVAFAEGARAEECQER